MRHVHTCTDNGHHASAIGLFVLYESFPRLTAGLKGCVYYWQRLATVTISLVHTFSSRRWRLHWLACLYMIYIDKLSYFHHKPRIKLRTTHLGCQCSDHQATTSPHIIHSSMLGRCFIIFGVSWVSSQRHGRSRQPRMQPHNGAICSAGAATVARALRPVNTPPDWKLPTDPQMVPLQGERSDFCTHLF